MAQDAPKRRFLSLIFLVSCISKSFPIKRCSQPNISHLGQAYLLRTRLQTVSDPGLSHGLGHSAVLVQNILLSVPLSLHPN